MRDRFREFWSPNLPMPTLYGISAMGTCFSVYEYTKETNCLAPPSIPRDLYTVNDVAPQARWKYELLEADGEAKFRSIVAEVKAIAQTIGNFQCYNTITKGDRLFYKRIIVRIIHRPPSIINALKSRRCEINIHYRRYYPSLLFDVK